MSLELISNEEHYEKVITAIARATSFVWIGTADIKDMHVKQQGQTQSFLATLNGLLQNKISVRLLHAKDPGPNFKSSFDKYPLLWKSMERHLCPRVHFKLIIIDGKIAYTGSANLTGAGLGMKSAHTRNFESGILTTIPQMVEAIMDQFDAVWMGKFCQSCKRKAYCNDPIV